MSADLLQFQWDVSRSGYKIVLGRFLGSQSEIDEPILTDGVGIGTGYERKTYFPLKHSALFCKFAELDNNGQAILNFANVYGFLRNDTRQLRLSDQPTITSDGRRGHLVGYGESLNSWIHAIDTMKPAVTLWDMAQNRDEEGLSKIIKWVSDDRVLYENVVNGMFTGTTIADKSDNPDVFGRFRGVGDLITPAKYCLQKMVNKELTESASPKLLWENNVPHRLGLYFAPSSLIGALWLQFAEAIGRNKEFKRCRECNGLFDVSGPGSRKDREFCRPACKTRAHRKKRRPRPN